MLSIMIILPAFVAWAWASEEDAMNKLVDRLIDKLFKRSLSNEDVAATPRTRPDVLGVDTSSTTPDSAKFLPKEKELKSRLALLRQQLKAENLAAYIIPHNDAHNSEYIADHDQRLLAISGFTGSFGTAVVTQTRALLWTDGRYFEQAQQQITSDWSFMKDRTPGEVRMDEWLAKELNAKDRVGIDPALTTITHFRIFESALRPRSIALVPLRRNLVDAAWGAGRPTVLLRPINLHPDRYHGQPISVKVDRVREAMKQKGVSALVVSALDQVAWLLNLRGSDISFNPVFFSYVVVSKGSVVLYVDVAGRLSPEASAYLNNHECPVVIKEYAEVFVDLRQISGRIWVDPDATSLAILHALGGPTYEETTPIGFWKSCKTDQEIEGMRQAQIRDGVAKTRWLFWLEDAMTKLATQPLDEVSIAEKLKDFRSKQKHFVGLSFHTISAFGPNGAIIHYIPQPERCAKADASHLYLCDSGAQYLDGTTDITRTVHFAEPTKHQQECFTRVLKGMIALSTAVFPEDTPGPALDILARQPLWFVGLDYLHGTSHGVGAYSNVHEGPIAICRISTLTRGSLAKFGLRVGMVVSNEPGYYEEGSFGIRIENLMVCKKKEAPHNFGGKTYCRFETLTVVPIQKKMIDLGILLDHEIQWVDSYHAMVREKLEPHMQSQAERERLVAATAPLLHAKPG